MNKTLTTITLVGLALVLLAGSGARMTLAQEPVQPPNHIISFTGTISEDVDEDDEGIYVTIQMTNNPYIFMRGDTEWVETTDTTIYYVWEGDVRKPATFADLEEGQLVSINAIVSTTAITASRVEVDKPRY